MPPQIQVNATRMELTRLRRRLATAVRGHALLKDKLEGLMQEFLRLLQRYKTARRELDQQYPRLLSLFLLAGMASSRRAVQDALAQLRSQARLSVARHNVAGVNVLRLGAHFQPEGGYSLLDVPLELDEAIEELRRYFPRVLELAELEHSVWLFIAEIERTRRRVNALEYVMIPSLRDAIKYIRSKLEENERGNMVRLMKIKEMRLAQQRRETAQQRGRERP